MDLGCAVPDLERDLVLDLVLMPTGESDMYVLSERGGPGPRRGEGEEPLARAPEGQASSALGGRDGTQRPSFESRPENAHARPREHDWTLLGGRFVAGVRCRTRDATGVYVPQFSLFCLVIVWTYCYRRLDRRLSPLFL